MFRDVTSFMHSPQGLSAVSFIYDLMNPPRLSLAISSKPSITPAPAVISTRNTSIAIRIAMEFQVC